MSGHTRGVQEIRTLSAVLGAGIHANERHVHQFQLASLEFERTRRCRERDAAVKRIREIDRLLVEIDETMRRHQEALGLKSDASDPSKASTSGDTPAKPRVLRY
jgi:hypothetical protein